MRTTRYLAICLVLTVIGLASLAGGVHQGSAGADFGTSLTANSIRICATSSGGWALVGVLATLGGIIFFVVALIASIRRGAA